MAASQAARFAARRRCSSDEDEEAAAVSVSAAAAAAKELEEVEVAAFAALLASASAAASPQSLSYSPATFLVRTPRKETQRGPRIDWKEESVFFLRGGEV